MLKERVELHTFTPEQILAMCAFKAKLDIIGPIFVGQIGSSEAKFLPDGSVEVRTNVQEGGPANQWRVR